MSANQSTPSVSPPNRWGSSFPKEASVLPIGRCPPHSWGEFNYHYRNILKTLQIPCTIIEFSVNSLLITNYSLILYVKN